MSLSPSQENYLEAIYLCQQRNEVVRVKNLARKLDVKPSSVHEALSALKERGLVVHERYGYVELTAEGLKIALDTYGKHKAIKRLLLDVLKLDEETADKEACAMEHFLSSDTIDRMSALTVFLSSETGMNLKWREALSPCLVNKEKKEK